VENGHTASSSQVMESIQSFLAALRRLAGSRGSAPSPAVPPATAALPRPVVVGRAACPGVLAGPVLSVPVGVSSSVPLPASRPSDGSLDGSVALHLCWPSRLPHHVHSPSEHCFSPSSSTFSLSAAEVMVQSFVVLFRCFPSAAESPGFLYIVGIVPPPRFRSWLVLPHSVGAHHPWALVLVLSGFGSHPAAVGARELYFRGSVFDVSRFPSSQPICSS